MTICVFFCGASSCIQKKDLRKRQLLGLCMIVDLLHLTARVQMGRDAERLL
jgi:hypothetical protein